LLKEEDDLSWYARKAGASAAMGRAGEPSGDGSDPSLLRALLARGIRGDPARRTLFNRRLPPGCRACLQGKGSNVLVTGLCTRECFFCFNPKPRSDEFVVHGIPVRSAGEGAALVERYRLLSVALSGGEPLLRLDRVLGLAREVRRLPRRVRLDLYTNGDLLTPETAERLRGAGIDSLRLNLAANGFDLRPVEAAVRFFPDVAVEIPVVPSLVERIRSLALDLVRLGVPFLILHELFECVENSGGMRSEGLAASDRGKFHHLLWRPVKRAGDLALEMLLFVVDHAPGLNAYYCSCLTQEDISRRGWLRRMRLAGGAS
jgi:pyruvate formate-lyase activating enzyme-like uncharacterized protein